MIAAQGETLVQFRAVDTAGFISPWAPSVPDSGSTVRIDRTLPTTPVVSGGSLTWQNVSSLSITAAGSTDSGGSGLIGYEVRTSTDGGATWSPGSFRRCGHNVGRGRDAGAVPQR